MKKIRVVEGHDNQPVRLVLHNGWIIDSETQRLFYVRDIKDRTKIAMQVNNIMIDLLDIDLMQVGHSLFQKVHEGTKFRWILQK